MEFKSIGQVNFGFQVLRSQHFCKNCNTFQVREVVEVNTRTATTAAPSVFSEVPANDDRCKIDVDMPKVLKKGLKKVLKSHQGCLRHCTTLFNLMHRSVSNLLSPNWPEVMRIVELSSLSGLNEAMPSGLPHRRFMQNPMLNLYDLTGWVSRSWMFGQFWSQVIREKPEVREREKVVEAAKAQERRWTTNFYKMIQVFRIAKLVFFVRRY